jgi:hypothetical protein
MAESQTSSDSTELTQAKDAVQPQVKIRWRAILLGAVLALAICVLIPFNNAYRQGTPLGGGHFPLAPFYMLVWLMIVSALIRRLLRGRNILTGVELLVSWALMVLLSGIAWTGLARTFFINLTAPFHLATVENRWAEVLQPLLPNIWYPQSPEAIQNFYNGLPGGRQLGWLEVLQRIPWDAWILPLLTWAGFIMLCYFVMVCVINLLSRQPLYNERMNFPLLRVPLLMQEAYDNNEMGRFFFRSVSAGRASYTGLSAPYQWNQFLQSQRSVDSDPDTCRQMVSEIRFICGVHQIKNLYLSGLYWFCISDLQTDIIFFLVFLHCRGIVDRALEYDGGQYSGSGLGGNIRSRHIATRRNPDDRCLSGIFRVPGLAGPVPFSRCGIKSFRVEEGGEPGLRMVFHPTGILGIYCRRFRHRYVVPLFRYSAHIFFSSCGCLFHGYPGGYPRHLPGRHRLLYIDCGADRHDYGFFRP